ncbi:MAG: NAD(P)-dependent oxidoreductase [Gemmatimonadetes bacterium]|nr:NAD(P)-dependent oxidoreductase [Gemmatimonadota bacterium]
MARVGLIGVGDMGSGMAANILKNGHELVVYDLRPEQLKPFVEQGAYAAKNAGEVGERSDFVFVMVMNGDQIKAILNNGLLNSMKPGSTFICTATILRSELVEIAQCLEERDIRIIDAPVSGGAPGAAAGTLTMMVAAQRDIFEDATEVLNAVGENIYHVGEEIGAGQTVKACLAVLTGVTYAGIFETLSLGVKAGVKAETLYEVINTSVVGSFLFRDTTQNILERNFVGQSRIGTMYKDLGIAKTLGRECGVPLFTLSSAAEWFQAGISVNPEEANWAIIKIFENMLDIEVKKR